MARRNRKTRSKRLVARAKRQREMARPNGRNEAKPKRRGLKPSSKPRRSFTPAKVRVRTPSRARGKTNPGRRLAKSRPAHKENRFALESAVHAMNRGVSLTAAAREFHLAPEHLHKFLRRHRLAKRKGNRWVTKDNRPRQVPVMTGGRFRVLTVRGYHEARLVGEHHQAVGEFVRSNSLEFIKPFKGQTVQATNGRRYALETDPNALHRIAAMDSPPFHEIYEIISPK